MRTENRRPTARRLSGIRLIAVGMVVALGLAGLPALMTAQAFIDDPSLSSGTAEASVKATISHDQVSGHEPQPGQTFKYNGTIEITPTTSGKYTGEVKITQSDTAPFKRLTAANLKFPAGVTVSEPTFANGTYTFKLSGLNLQAGQSLRGTFSAPATLSKNYDGNSEVVARVNASITPDGKLSLNSEPPTIKWDLDSGFCSGVGTMTWVVPKDSIGGWLMDIKFADISKPNHKDVQLEPLPSDPSQLKESAGGRQTLKVTDPSGRDITDSVLPPNQDMLINPSDNSAPYYATDPILGSNPLFLDSLNWRYNPKEYAGKAWLSSGTKVTVTRGFKLRGCMPIHASTRPDNRRDIMGAQLDIARKITSPSGSDIDVFGSYKPTGPWCQDIYMTDSTGNEEEVFQPDVTTNYGVKDPDISSFSPFDPLNSGTNPKVTLRGSTVWKGGIAIGEKFPKRIYYYVRNNSILQQKTWYLEYFDMTNGKVVKVAPIGGSFPELNDGPLAFDPDGNLWGYSGSKVYRFEMSADGNSARPVKMGSVAERYPDIVYDLGFLDNGDLVVIAAGPGSEFDVDVKLYNKAELRRGQSDRYYGSYRKPSNLHDSSGRSLNGVVRGVAFGPDGKLYMSISRKNNKGYSDTIIKLESNAGPRARKTLSDRDRVNYRQTTKNGIMDMASCSYGHTGGVQLRKYPIDPVTGELGPAGGSVKNRVLFNAVNRVNTVDYVVGIENLDGRDVTATAANNTGGIKNIGPVTDTFTAPDGFRVKKIVVTNANGDELFNQDYSATVDSPEKSFQFSPGVIKATSTKYVKVQVTLEYLAKKTLKPKDMECRTNSFGIPGTGLFNQVRLKDGVRDSDGLDNNDACIPLRTTRAHLKLIKQIVDKDGNDITSDHISDVQKFTLGATQTDGTAATGQSSVAGKPVYNDRTREAVAVDQDVNTGTYKLSEVTVPGYSYHQGYKCRLSHIDNPYSYKSIPGDSLKEVEVPDDSSVTCVIKNTRTPHVSVRKEASYPTDASRGAGRHIGNQVLLQENEVRKDGKTVKEYQGYLYYRIVVHNDSNFPVDTGEVRESFRIPEGLLLRGSINITDFGVYYPESGRAYDLNTSISEAELKDPNNSKGVVIASRIENMQPGADHIFNVTIPVKADDSKAAGETQTKWEKNAARLGECQSETIGSEDVVKINQNPQHGVINLASIQDEYKPQGDTNNLWYRDNFACIPVKLESPTGILVHKVDNAGNLSLGGAEFKVCSSADNQNRNPGTECTPLKVLNLSNCNSYPSGSPQARACANHYGSSLVGGTQADGSVFYADGLIPDKRYWLVETKAPECVTKGEEYCAELIPEPLQFTVDRDGIITPYTAPRAGMYTNVPECEPFDPYPNPQCKETTKPFKQVGDTFMVYKNLISVRDPRRANLPVSGGSGLMPIILASGLLIIVSLGYGYKTSVAAKRSAIRAKTPR